jgi:hypothetical protein
MCINLFIFQENEVKFLSADKKQDLVNRVVNHALDQMETKPAV